MLQLIIRLWIRLNRSRCIHLANRSDSRGIRKDSIGFLLYRIVVKKFATNFQLHEADGLLVSELATEIPSLKKASIYSCNFIESSPPPGSYNPIESLKKVRPSKAFSFGISREAYRKVFSKQNTIPDPSVPGPGTYPVYQFVGKEGRRPTIKGKFKNLSTVWSWYCGE